MQQKQLSLLYFLRNDDKKRSLCVFRAETNLAAFKIVFFFFPDYTNKIPICASANDLLNEIWPSYLTCLVPSS